MIKNEPYDSPMTSLGSLAPGSTLKATPLPAFDIDAAAKHVEATATTLFATIGGPTLGDPSKVRAHLVAMLYQDDDAHDTCSLTACLNPLHPGPCKGWKGTLHKVAPHVWKGIEEERVKKANAKRVAKIADLKAQGKPIPKKLLTPIVAKPHPDAGKTANSAGGEAHAAGKAITESSGIKTSEPGKVTLGHTVKTLKVTDATNEKGAKGKKPTVASKGIATVIAQEKVTPQYKLDKAAGITDEQWKALSGTEQDTIRGELKKIQVDGFGPQQKKATDLLAKLDRKDNAPKPEPKPEPKTEAELKAKIAEIDAEIAENEAKAAKAGAPPKPATGKLGAAKTTTLPDGTPVTVKTPSAVAKDIQKNGSVDLVLDGKVVKTGFEGNNFPGKLVMAPGGLYTVTHDGKKYPLGKGEHVKVALPGPDGEAATKATAPATTQAQTAALIALADAIPGVKAGSLADPVKLAQVVDKLKESGPLTAHPKIGILVDKLAQSALKQATADKMPGLGHGKNDVGISEFNKEIADHIEHGKPGLPPLVAKMVAHHEAVKAGGPSAPNVKTAVEDLVKKGLPPKLGDLTPGAPGTITAPSGKTYQKIKNAAESTPDQPAHIQHAIAMAKGTAPGASWSKNHLAAYEKLSADEFQKLDPDVQTKIVSELKKGADKFLDPKKVTATKELLAKFNNGKTAAKPSAPADPIADINDHSVKVAEANKAAKTASIPELAGIAKKLTGMTDKEDPDSPSLGDDASELATGLVEHATKTYDSSITGKPAVKQAMADFKAAAAVELHARYIAEAKKKAYNKVSQKLYADGSPQVTEKLSPIEKASLQQYQKYLLMHPSKTSDDDLAALSVKTKDAKAALETALQSELKKANAPKPEDMTPAQLATHVDDLLTSPGYPFGEDPVHPNVTLTLAQTKAAAKVGEDAAKQYGDKYSPDVLADPNVAAKQVAIKNAATQLMMTGASTTKLNQHLAAHHDAALASGKAANGNPLTAEDKQIIKLHKEKLLKDHQYLNDTATKQEAALKKAGEDFEAAAQAASKPKAPAVLSDYDKSTVVTAYSSAWGKAATKAASYGVSGWDTTQKMKGHPDYASFTQDLGDLRALSGKIAAAHAMEQVAQLNVPTHPDTGNVIVGTPEWAAWQDSIHATQALEKEFTARLNVAQKKLDDIRTSAGLKKRALPKVDAPAVKAAAAETASYTTGNYTGPNYGKPTAAKNYMVAKLGPKLGVPHQTAAEKKAAKATGKLGDAAASTPATPVNAGTPVTVTSGSSIAGIKDSLKKEITLQFKAMPKGKYLADPGEDIFDNLVNLAAAYGKDHPGGLSVDQIVKTIDETHSKNLHVSNSGMLEKKLTDWLATGAGAAYAKTHSTPDAKVVKQLSGEVDVPPGITLAPGEKVQKVAGPGPHDTTIPASAFKAASANEAEAAQSKYMKEQGVKWSATQKSALKGYTGSLYHTYNKYLRTGGTLSAAMKEDILHIQSAMMPLQQHTLLKRGTGWDALPAQYHGFANAKQLVGKTIEEPGFTSTTVGGESGNFGGPLQLEIEAPVGTPAAFVKSLSYYKNENEMLLAAGTKFKVLSVQEKGGKTVMRVRIVGDK